MRLFLVLLLAIIMQTANAQQVRKEVTRGRVPNKTKVVDQGERLEENARQLCVTKVITLDESPQEDIGHLLLGLSDIYPGAFYKSNAITSGSYAKPNLHHRPYNLVIDYVASGSVHRPAIVRPRNGYVSKTAVNNAMAGLLNKNQAVQAATAFTYTIEEVNSQKELDVMGYGSFNGYGASVKAKFNYNKTTKKHTYIVRFHQKYYSISVDEDNNIINKSTSPESVKTDDVYVSEVTYGRVGFIKIESNYDKEIVKAALDIAYKGYGTNVKVGGKVYFSQLNKEWKFTAYAVGGTSVTFSDIEGFRNWVKNAKWNSKVSQVPIAYKLRFLNNNQIADVRLTSRYTKRECRPYTATEITFIGLGYLDIVNDHDHGDCSRIGLDVDVEMYVNGKRINGKNARGQSTTKIVKWNETDNGRTVRGKPIWMHRHREIVKLHESSNRRTGGQALEKANKLKSAYRSLTFVIDQNELEKNNVKFKIISNIRSCHKSCGHCGGFHCGVTTIGGKNYKEFYLKNLLKNKTNGIAYFDTGIIRGTGNHTWKLYFKVKNF